jgi:membrane protease YdiL (CAAX protease family)
LGWADAFAIVGFAAVHAFKPSHLDEPVSHDAAGAWQALRTWAATMVDPARFGPTMLGLLLFGTLLTVAYRRSRTLWLPIGIHAAGAWALLAYGAFTERRATPVWAGTKALYDGVPGWTLLLVAIAWLALRKPVPAPDAPPPEPPEPPRARVAAARG